ncbi:hypothetical protein GCM10010207_15520 [Streptomyces atratus]|nr:hypothetical protein GCM10010207_15520 [Streptomyces atratus]
MGVAVAFGDDEDASGEGDCAAGGLASSVAVARGGDDGAADALSAGCALQPAVAAVMARTASAAVVVVPAQPRVLTRALRRDVLPVMLRIISAP